MKTKQLKTALSRVFCIVLIVAMALFTIGCGQQTNQEENSTSTTVTTVYNDGDVIGNGDTTFSLSVTDGTGDEKNFTVNTDQTTVGAALLKVNIIAGEDGDYGLYIKEVNGIAADYDIDQTYWAFYIDGEYAMSGVDKTDIVTGSTYALKVEK